MKFFLFLWVIFALLNQNPIRIRITAVDPELFGLVGFGFEITFPNPHIVSNRKRPTLLTGQFRQIFVVDKVNRTFWRKAWLHLLCR
jgi:hypothetical protein